MTVHMTQTQKQMVRRLRAKGLKIKEIARELNYTADAIRVTVRDRQCRAENPTNGRRRRDDSARGSERRSFWV